MGYFRFRLVTPDLMVARNVCGAGVLLLIFGFYSIQTQDEAAFAPKTVRTSDLRQKKPKENTWAEVTHFYPIREGVAFQGSASAWRRVWVPIIPGDSRYVEAIASTSTTKPTGLPPAKEVVMVLETSKYKSPGELESLMQRRELTGMTRTPVLTFKRETVQQLESTFPGLNTADVVLLVDGERPFSGVALWPILTMVIGSILFIPSVIYVWIYDFQPA